MVQNNNNYRYIGKVKRNLIYQTRDDENILIVDLFIDYNNSPIKIDTEAKIYDYKNNNGHKFMKYKMDCFTKLKQTPSGNWCSGIMEGVILD